MSDQAPRSREVFLSYSIKNKKLADATCAVLEKHGLRCWIAPRDILPGTEWGAAIMGGLAASKIMVLIFSADANASSQVRKEVAVAISKGIAVLPFRVEDVLPEGALEYALGNTHWLDGFTPPLECQLETLAGAVEALLAGEVPTRPMVAPASEAPPPKSRPMPAKPRPIATPPPERRRTAGRLKTTRPMPAKPRPMVTPVPERRRTAGRLKVTAGLIVAAVAIGIGGYVILGTSGKPGAIPSEEASRNPSETDAGTRRNPSKSDTDTTNSAARASAQLSECANNLRLIGSGLANYELANGSYPRAVLYGPDGRTPYSWRVAVLPFIGDFKDIYDQYKFDEPWDGPNNRQLLPKMPSVFHEPQSKDDRDLGLTNYIAPVGRHTIISNDRTVERFWLGNERSSVTDGTSNTIMIVESQASIPWTSLQDLSIGDSQMIVVDNRATVTNINSIHTSLTNAHLGGFHALFCSGDVRFIKNEVRKEVLGALLTRDGGEVLSAGAY